MPPPSDASSQQLVLGMPVEIPAPVIEAALAKLVKGEWSRQDDGTEALVCGREITVAGALPVLMGLTYRPTDRRERARLDADFDAFYERAEFEPLLRLWWELGRMWWGTRIMPTDNQLTDALKALPSYTLPPPPEDELDEEDDTVPPAPTLVERLAYLLELGTSGPGYTATPISARRAGIIQMAMEAVAPAEAKAPAPTIEWKTDIERLHDRLGEAKRTGKAEFLFAAPGLFAMVNEGQWNDFIGTVKMAVKESKNGLNISIAALNKKRRERQDANRAANVKDNIARTTHTGAPPEIITCATWEIAGIVTATSHFAVDAGRKLYVYQDGVYVPQGETHIKRRVKAILTEARKSEQWHKKKVEEVIEYVTVDAPLLLDRPPLDVVNVANGLLDVNARKLLSHSPDHLSPVQIPVTYDPEARCPSWDRFVATTFPADAAAIAWEIPAWLMAPDTSIQKAILLTGDGANGKSTYLAAVLAFIGRRNASAVSLHKLEGDRFSVSRLVGKLANVCPDLPSTDLASTSVFKAITGGDVLTGERKFESSFDFTPYARLVFSANHPPKSQDASPAFFRRWIVVPFDKTFTAGAEGTIPRGELDAMLADPAELSGVLNKVLEALARLRRQGFTECESTRQAMNEFRQTTDPMAVWLDSNTLVKSGAFVAADHLYNLFSLECVRKNRPTPTTTAFGRAISHLRPTVEKKQRTVNGALRWCYVGIGLLTSDSE
jgi:P4 family phage/plasmid primase-like protien